MSKRNKAKFSSIRFNLILTFLIGIILTGMTIGFARYNRILNLSGNVVFSPQGEVYISNVVFTGGTHVTSNPTFTNTSINFGLNFIGDSTTTNYTANFDVTVTNETFYNQIFAMDYWQPTITDENGNPVDDAYIEYELVGIQNGDLINRGESVTFSVQIVLHADGGSYNVEGDTTVGFADSNTGALVAQVLAPTTGDLRGNNEYAAFTVNVANTFDYAQSFNLQLRNNSHFLLTDQNGNALNVFSVDANAESNFTVYVKKSSGVDFATDYERANIYLSSASVGDINCGRITLLVDKSIIYTDNEPPVISNVQMNVLDANGEANITWEAADDVTISHFTVLVYDTSNRLVSTIVTEDDTASAVVTGLADGNYYAKVYGEDSLGNVASSSDIENATTSSGYCSRSSAKRLEWTFTVTYDLTRLRASGGNTAVRGQTYTTTFTVTSNSYSFPNSITVTMGGTTLNQGTGYTYNRTTGTVSIPNVSGNIVIRASARWSGCLIEGTDILLADGSTKKIEDVRYNDLLAVWNYETGQLDAAYPIWIEREHRAGSYQWAHFSDGSDLRTVLEHGVFSTDLNRFISVRDDMFRPGTSYYKVDANGDLAKVQLESVATVRESQNYYHIVSARYYNIIANGFITTDGTVALSNLYGFDRNVTWPANRQVVAREYADFADTVPYYMYVGMRMGEIKVLENYNAITIDQFKAYLSQNQTSFTMSTKPELLQSELHNFDATHLLAPLTSGTQRVWPVSFGAQKQSVAEGQSVELPSVAGVKMWRNSVDGKLYRSGESVRIYCGTHFAPLN